MENQDNHRYDDIINLPNPTSKKHPRMSLYDRAAQFSPFAALTGHEAAIKETARQTDEKLMLSDEVIAELNEKLNLIAETIGTQQRVRITYFVPDNKKAGGAYITCSGCVKKFDAYEHTVIMEDKTVIPIKQISDIDFFILRASGQSMIEAGIDDGDLVVVKKQVEANEGDIVVALVDNQNTLKRYFRDDENKKIILHPENKKMKDIIVDECCIQGVACHIIKEL